MKTIRLSNGSDVMVDDIDYHHLSKFNWHAKKIHYNEGFYSAAWTVQDGKRKCISMHREIMNAPKGLEVDHRDGNVMDNRRLNLRICTKHQNSLNRSGQKNSLSKYRGVSWDSRKRKWVARINVDKKIKYLGEFITELEAAIIINITIRKYHGEFANTNKLIKVSYE